MVLVNTLCTAVGPGSASLAGAWENYHGLTNIEVWGDTTDYMYSNFASALGGSYPNTLVVDIDTMEIRYFSTGAVNSAVNAINEIVNADHPCAD